MKNQNYLLLPERQNNMKKIFRSIYVMLKGIGYARAAADAARNGNHDRAKHLMQEYGKCK